MQPPIFILGITERSGTNYLFHLLCQHPDCHPGGPIWENYLTFHLDQLVAFAEASYTEWNPEWKVPETVGSSDVLLEHLGNGVIEYLNRQLPHDLQQLDKGAEPATGLPRQPSTQRTRRLITKNPSVRNLDCFFRLFPRAPLLILIRDGRAVVESGVRTFGLSYEQAMRNWTAAGKIILRFFEQPAARQFPVLLVKYEDLFQQTEQELRRIFAFLDLQPERYDFAAPETLPVVGSSDLAKQPGGKVHWAGAKKEPGFDPTKRWEGWSPALLDRFMWIGGEVLERFGYVSPDTERAGLWRAARHKALSLAWHIRRRLK